MPKRDKAKGEEESRKETPLPDEASVICVVERLLGGEHFLARCVDGRSRVTRIPGRYRKKLWIREGDVVLVAPWDTQPERKGDMLYRYSNEEVKKLVEMGLIPPEHLEGIGPV